jgi:hypothetical protein
VQITPLGETSVKGTSPMGMSVQSTPLKETPLQGTPLMKTSVQGTPLMERSVQGTPLMETSVQGTPLREMVEKSTLPRGMPVQSTPLRKMSEGIGCPRVTAQCSILKHENVTVSGTHCSTHSTLFIAHLQIFKLNLEMNDSTCVKKCFKILILNHTSKLQILKTRQIFLQSQVGLEEKNEQKYK